MADMLANHGRNAEARLKLKREPHSTGIASPTSLHKS
jgi:hypothetical protein